MREKGILEPGMQAAIDVLEAEREKLMKTIHRDRRYFLQLAAELIREKLSELEKAGEYRRHLIVAARQEGPPWQW